MSNELRPATTEAVPKITPAQREALLATLAQHDALDLVDVLLGT